MSSRLFAPRRARRTLGSEAFLVTGVVMDVVLYSLGALALIGAVLVGASARVVQQLSLIHI